MSHRLNVMHFKFEFRRLLIDDDLNFELELHGTRMEIHSNSEAVRVFIDTHVLIGQSSLA